MNERRQGKARPHHLGDGPGNEEALLGHQSRSGVRENQVLEQARWLREHALSAIPIHALLRRVNPDGAEELICSCAGKATCDRPGKHVAVLWAEFQSRLATKDELDTWFDTGKPRSGLGIVTGQISGLFDIETDPPDGAASWQELVDGRQVPSTWSFTSGRGGRHRLFTLPKGVHVGTQSGIRPGIDVRGEGGMAVLPPSLHRTGVRYAWVEGCAPWETELADAPQWLLDELTSPPAAEEPSTPIRRRTTRYVDEGAPNGERNVDAHRYASRLRGLGIDREEAEILVCQFAANCDPPLEEKEWRGCLDSAWGHYVPEGEKVDETFANVGDLDPMFLEEFITGSGSRTRSQLWKLTHNFSDLPRVRADRKLVGYAARLGWSQADILALVRAHRQKHDHDPTRGLSVAEIRQMLDEDECVDLSALRLIPFGGRVVRLVQLGERDARYEIHLDDGEIIELSGPRSLTSPAKFNEDIVLSGYRMSQVTKRRFDDIADALLALREVEPLPGAESALHDRITNKIAGLTGTDQIIGAPSSYATIEDALGHHVDGLDPRGGCLTWLFVHVDGTVFIVPRTLRVALMLDSRIEISFKSIATWLWHLGFPHSAELSYYDAHVDPSEGPRQRHRATVHWTEPGWADAEDLRLVLARHEAQEARDAARRLESGVGPWGER